MKKLYVGGFGKYKYYTAAESQEEAVKNIGEKYGINHLPVTAEVIDNVDGYQVFIQENEADSSAEDNQADINTDNQSVGEESTAAETQEEVSEETTPKSKKGKVNK